MKLAKHPMIAALALWAIAPAPLLAQDETPAQQEEQQTGNLIAAEAVRGDLKALYETLQEASVDLYAYRSKADYDAFYAGLQAQITGPMTRLDAAVLFQRLAAYARIGHIRSYNALFAVIGEMGAEAKFAPLFIRIERNGQVLLTDPANADGTAPAGAQLIAIDGEQIARVLSKTRDLVSAERNYMANTLFEDLFPVFYWALHSHKTEVELTLRVGEETTRVTVPTMDLGAIQAMLAEHAAPTPETNFDAREFRMVGDRIGYLRPGPFSALEGEEPEDGRTEVAMVRFLDESFEQLLAASASDLIIDMRNNSGGDIAFSDPMVAWFADRPFRFASSFTLRASAAAKAHYDRVAGPDADISPFLARLAAEERAEANGALYPFAIDMIAPREGARFDGQVWVLVNRKSYSNATSTAALIQDYGFGTIMGEETADVPTSFASIFPYTLPETGFGVDLAKSYFVRPSGDETVRGVIPEIDLPRQEIGSADDTMLAAALEAIKAAN